MSGIASGRLLFQSSHALMRGAAEARATDSAFLLLQQYRRPESCIRLPAVTTRSRDAATHPVRIHISAPSLGCGQCGCPLTRPFQKRRIAGAKSPRWHHSHRGRVQFGGVSGADAFVAGPPRRVLFRACIPYRLSGNGISSEQHGSEYQGDAHPHLGERALPDICCLVA